MQYKIFSLTPIIAIKIKQDTIFKIGMLLGCVPCTITHTNLDIAGSVYSSSKDYLESFYIGAIVEFDSIKKNKDGSHTIQGISIIPQEIEDAF